MIYYAPLLYVFYETYINDLMEISHQDQLIAFAQQEYKQFLNAVQELNGDHLNWHPRGNGHELLLTLIDQLQILKSQPGKVLIDFTNTQGYVVVEPAYQVHKPSKKAVGAI
ncbi:hypothetical protein OL548_20905 [Lysinibacillus sp. MHQ-1]|nr:hypothetical protein OL548_20905 [Lysinibacillus sp. MHQ-1]